MPYGLNKQDISARALGQLTSNLLKRVLGNSTLNPCQTDTFLFQNIAISPKGGKIWQK